MEKIKWSEKVTNEQALERIEEKNTLLNNIVCRKVNWVYHILRKNFLLLDANEGEMAEVEGVRRGRTQFLDDFRKRI